MVELIALLLSAVLFTAIFFGNRKAAAAKVQVLKDSGRSDAVLNELRRQRDENAEPSVVLNLATSGGFSKFGGDPDLPDGASWPTGHQGHRAFVLQIDLAEIPSVQRLGWLPAEGRIYVFSEWDGLDMPDCVHLTYTIDNKGIRTPPPSDLTRRFQERPVAFEPMISYPDLDWFDVDTRKLDVVEHDLFMFFEEKESWPDYPGPKIGGFPDEIQSACMRLDCELISRVLGARTANKVIPDHIEQASHDWRLLFQIASNDELKMDWGGGGLLYVLIRREDARRGDFSKTVTISQLY